MEGPLHERFLHPVEHQSSQLEGVVQVRISGLSKNASMQATSLLQHRFNHEFLHKVILSMATDNLMRARLGGLQHGNAFRIPVFA